MRVRLIVLLSRFFVWTRALCAFALATASFVPAAAAGPNKVRARFAGAKGLTPALSLEVADTLAGRATGLMYRRRLPSKHGMLFVFDEAAPRSFWMKDTYLSLDMIFVDAACKVVHLIARAEPHSTASHACALSSRLVVELPGGSAEQLGLQLGDVLHVAWPRGPKLGHCLPPGAP